MKRSVRINLDRTRTFPCRYCIWLQVQPGIGILETYEGKSEDKVKKTGRYLVTEHEPTYCRRFQFLKEAVAGGDEYWVCIGGDITQDTCDCKGFESQNICKHSDSIRAIVDAKKFVEKTDDPVSCFFEDIEVQDPL